MYLCNFFFFTNLFRSYDINQSQTVIYIGNNPHRLKNEAQIKQLPVERYGLSTACRCDTST